MKKFNMADMAAIIIGLLPLAYLFYMFPSLPASVPVHFGKSGLPDRYGDKSEVIIIECIMMGIAFGVYLLLRFLPRIDPKKSAQYGEPLFSKLALGLMVFLAALAIVTLYAIQHKGFKIDKVLYPIMGLMFAFIGNIMYNLKPNYFAGIRTPWTLEDNATWKATHRVAGKLWFAGGIIIACLTLFIEGAAGKVVFLSIVGVMAIIPVVFSYIYFKGHQPDKNNVTK